MSIVLLLALSPFADAAPEGMGGVYVVTINRGSTTWSGSRSVYGPALPGPGAAPRGGMEGMCLAGGEFPYKPTNGDATKWTLSQSGDVVNPAEVAVPCGSGQPARQLFSVLPCDGPGQYVCPTQVAGTATQASSLLLTPGVYSVTSSAKNGSATVNGSAVVIVRPLSEGLSHRVETWCTSPDFAFAKSGSQTTAGGTPVTLATNVMEMTSNTVTCSDGGGGQTACNAGQAALDCAANGAPASTYPNRTRYHMVRTNAP